MPPSPKAAIGPAICDYEGSNYRSDFWEGQGREYEDRAERIALGKLLPPSGERLVEIGAGFGRLADLYRGYRRVYLVDYATSQLRQAQESWADDSRFVFVAANLYRLPFPGSFFDTAVTVRVLHHVQDLPAALAETGRVLRRNGTYVLEYANKRHLRAILRYVFRRGKPGERPFSLDPYEFVPLNFDFHPQYIAQLLGQCGFTVERELSVSHFRVGFLKRCLPAPVLARVDGWLQGPTARFHLTPSQFVRARRISGGEADAAHSGTEFSCPKCRMEGLERQSSGFRCRACGTLWPVEGGIYDFRYEA